MRDASRTRAAVRLGVLVVVLVGLPGGGWWLSDRAARRSQITPPVSSTPAPAAAPASAAQARAEPGLEGLGDAAHAQNAPTTEADPPPAKDGVSWGHAAGLHQAPDPLRLKASAAFVVDPRSGEVLVRKNENALLPIASLTKLMTALVLTEAGLPLDEMITVTEDDRDLERHSRSRLRVGTSLTRGEALRLALMSSENRAAHALGRTFPGGVDAFVQAMNRKAQALGMKQTTYADPTGLSNRNRSTARDVAVVAAAASKQPLIREYSTTPEHEAVLGSRRVRFNNSDRLVKSSRWDIHLQKTGYIVEAGQCLVVNATMAGRNLILVLLDSADRRSRMDDAERIRHWATGEPYPTVRRVSLREPDSKPNARAKGSKPAQRPLAARKKAKAKAAARTRARHK